MAGAKVKTLAGQDRFPRVCSTPPAGFHTDDRLKWRNSMLEKQLFQILSSQHLMKQGQDQTRDEDGYLSIVSIRLNCCGSKPLCFTSPYHPFPTSLSYLLPCLLNLLGKVMREREQHPRSFGCLFQHLFFTGIPLLSVSPSSPFSSLSTLADVSENQPHSVDTETSLLLLLVTWS